MEFLAADARAFHLPPVFHGVICTCDSLSYMLTLENLERVFSRVHVALRPRGAFVFDLSLEEAYKTEWQKSCPIIDGDEACLIRGSYDEHGRLGQTLITRSHRKLGWERTDVELHTRCYKPVEILHALDRSGSQHTEELRRELGPGRARLVARSR